MEKAQDENKAEEAGQGQEQEPLEALGLERL